VTEVPAVRLNDGRSVPQLGFGVYQIEPDDTERAVSRALEIGYRHIDAAQLYGNEEGVGRAIAASGLARDELFVTTKLDIERHGRDSAREALDESLERLGLEYVDLYLIHWPRPAEDRYVETWTGFEQIAATGRARSIGVSNFLVAHLERLAAETATVPAVNQVELHPWLPQQELRAYHRDRGIVTQAYSPLAQGELLAHPVIAGLAARHGRSPAQIVLAWHLGLGNVVFPKSVRPERMRENLDVLDITLADADVTALARLESGRRTGPHPDEV
jgi:2,5-diketo-D-gluconate reductase A